MGGEKRCLHPLCSLGGGSPPHGRGKVHDLRKISIGRGITPAWAGKSILYYYDYNKL